MSKSRVYEKNGKVIYELNRNTTIVSKSSDDRYLNTSGIEIVDFSKTGNDRYPDVDVFILNGKEIWSKEKNGKDKLPGFIDGWLDFENGNNDEFGNSDTVFWVDDEDYLAVYYKNPQREIRWDYDGNVIFDSAEKEQDK